MRIIINRNVELANLARTMVKENNGYCPCALEKNKDTKCMCKDFRTMFSNNEIGECYCGLYEIVE